MHVPVLCARNVPEGLCCMRVSETLGTGDSPGNMEPLAHIHVAFTIALGVKVWRM